jgi:hypothetical protein
MIVDISNPKNPTKISEVLSDTPLSVGIDKKNHYCMTPTHTGQMIVSDISDPENPETIVTASIAAGYVSEIAFLDSYTFVSYRNEGFRIYNFTNPNFNLIYTDSDTQGETLALKDDILYFGNPAAGIKVFNISNIASPVFLRTLFCDSAYDMYISDNFLYVGCHWNGFRIYSISNLANPSLLESKIQDDGGEAQGAAGNSTHLYIADNWGVEAYDMSNPSSPVEVAEVTQGVGAAHDLDIDDQYVYVALGGGLNIYELSATKSTYFPPYLYYLIPISAVVLGGGTFLIIWLRKRKKILKMQK